MWRSPEATAVRYRAVSNPLRAKPSKAAAKILKQKRAKCNQCDIVSSRNVGVEQRATQVGVRRWSGEMIEEYRSFIGWANSITCQTTLARNLTGRQHSSRFVLVAFSSATTVAPCSQKEEHLSEAIPRVLHFATGLRLVGDMDDASI
jgi:arginyl-tRNA--protein-N-Asp/Glu arginylyltransferase